MAARGKMEAHTKNLSRIVMITYDVHKYPTNFTSPSSGELRWKSVPLYLHENSINFTYVNFKGRSEDGKELFKILRYSHMRTEVKLHELLR